MTSDAIRAKLFPFARFLFRTRDGLLAPDNCPDVDDSAVFIMRPIRDMRGMEYRRYEWRGEIQDGLKVFEES